MRRNAMALGAAGVVGAALVWWLLAARLPAGAARADPASRIALGAASLLPGVVVLAAMLLAQMVVRFATGTFDPTLGQDGRFLVVNQRVITNTVEQTVCFAPAILALSAAAAPWRMGMVVALGLTFALARIVFWLGYLRAPLLRAPGMAATGTVNLAALAAAAWAWAG